jgi:protein-S-isoprenylcysteine O-methyltransferase Ste14
MGAILCFLSYSFFVPHWLILLISAVNIAIVYAFILQEEAQNVDRFGSEYRRYMEAVPRANPVAGILGRMRSEQTGKKDRSELGNTVLLADP